MFAGKGNLLQAVLYLVSIIYMCRRDGRHTYDRIHRRPDIVTHIRQEFALGLRRFFRCLTGLVQFIDLSYAYSVILEEDQKKHQQDRTACQQCGYRPLLIERLHRFIQNAKRQYNDQIPF